MGLPNIPPRGPSSSRRGASVRARVRQSGSIRRLLARRYCSAGQTAAVSKTSSVTSSANGHCSPAAARPFQIVLDRAARHAKKSPDLARAHAIVVKPQKGIAIAASSVPLAGIPFSSSNIDESGVPQGADLRGTNSENQKLASGGRLHLGIRGRFQIGMVAGIKSESPAGLNRNHTKSFFGPMSGIFVSGHFADAVAFYGVATIPAVAVEGSKGGLNHPQGNQG